MNVLENVGDDYRARCKSDELILLVDEGESLLNSLYSSISISTCKNKRFATMVKRSDAE